MARINRGSADGVRSARRLSLSMVVDYGVFVPPSSWGLHQIHDFASDSLRMPIVISGLALPVPEMYVARS